MAGLRYNKDKIRPSLHPEEAQMFVDRRWTKGAEKYEPGNWKKGMVYSEMIDSIERHLSALKRGIIIDTDWDGELDQRFGINTHMDGIALNASMILHHWFEGYESNLPIDGNNCRIGLDIDGVCADLCGGLGIETENYNDKDFYEAYKKALEDLSIFETLPVLESAQGIIFEPVAYITSRDISLRESTERWLRNSGLPWAPVEFTDDKVSICRKYRIDTFVEDSYINFQKIRESGIRCFLMDQPYNRKHYAGIGGRLRIKHLNEIFK